MEKLLLTVITALCWVIFIVGMIVPSCEAGVVLVIPALILSAIWVELYGKR